MPNLETNIVLQDIYIYPIKSCAGIRRESAQMTLRGLEHDRRWMLVDEDCNFVTARTEHRLVTFRTALHETRISVTAEGQGTLSVPLAQPSGPKREVTVWRNTVEGVENEEGSAWFSNALERKIHLVFMPDAVRRPVNPKYGRETDVLSFADAYPVLVVGQASLDDLNGRLENPISMRRFRPNLVVAGEVPFGEDEWTSVHINDVHLRAVKPCDRCSVTTVDPETGLAGKEPLKHLASFRTLTHDGQRKVLFGMNLIPDGEGQVRTGQSVRVK